MLKKRRTKHTNSKLLIAVILIIVIVVGAYSLNTNKKIKKNTSANNYSPNIMPTDTQTVQKEIPPTVYVTNAGFSPSVITVKKGTMVAWTNKSDSLISINSDPHPTHELYPRLSLVDIPNGSSMGFIFNESGTYKYHNHHNPSQTGTVVVE